MGWTFMRDTGGKTRKAYLDSTLSWENDTVKATLWKSAMVGSVYYAAVESVSKTDGKRQVWAAVFLTKSIPRAKDGYTFGYKDMTECMGPVESKCPPGILDLLTETQSDYAREWRERCRASARLKASPAPKPGTAIRFAEPITFTDGATHSEFIVTSYIRRGKSRTAFKAPNGCLYRITGYKSRAYTVATSERTEGQGCAS